MIRLIYTSVQTGSLTSVDFEQLCYAAAASNKARGVQGMLLYNGSEFMQCLEGSKASVSAVYRKIQHDSRHTDIRLLVLEPVHSSLFNNWSMWGLSTVVGPGLYTSMAPYTLLDHRLCRPWRSLGEGAADLIYEYAKVKAELENSQQLAQLPVVLEADRS